MNPATEKSQMAVENIAIVCFVLERMIIFFEQIMNFVAFLLKKTVTGPSQLHITEG